jgi:hypothetical protein
MAELQGKNEVVEHQLERDWFVRGNAFSGEYEEAGR